MEAAQRRGKREKEEGCVVFVYVCGCVLERVSRLVVVVEKLVESREEGQL